MSKIMVSRVVLDPFGEEPVDRVAKLQANDSTKLLHADEYWRMCIQLYKKLGFRSETTITLGLKNRIIQLEYNDDN